MLQKENSNEISIGIDLTDYYISVEWDILRVPAVRNEKFYICCEEPYPDIMFYMTLRRKTLFYTVNLIIPCVGISFLSVLVFYLPSHSGEKVSLSISILLSLTVFFLLLVEIIPSTSLTVPLLGKYLLFTMVLVTLSVVVTIVVLNVNFRSPVTHRMAPWVRVVFIETLPRFLLIERPEKDEGGEGEDDGLDQREGDEDDDEEIGEICSDGEDHHQATAKPPGCILTEVFHVQENSDKYDGYCGGANIGKRYAAEYELPPPPLPTLVMPPPPSLVMPPPPPSLPMPPPPPLMLADQQQHRAGLEFAVAVEEALPPPPPTLGLPGLDDDLFGPCNPNYVTHDDLGPSPTFERLREIERTIEDARFIAQHAKNKDKFESVSITHHSFIPFITLDISSESKQIVLTNFDLCNSC